MVLAQVDLLPLKILLTAGHAQTVGLPPVFGEFSMSANKRGVPRSCPLDSTVMGIPLR